MNYVRIYFISLKSGYLYTMLGILLLYKSKTDFLIAFKKVIIQEYINYNFSLFIAAVEVMQT